MLVDICDIFEAPCEGYETRSLSRIALAFLRALIALAVKLTSSYTHFLLTLYLD